MQKSQTTKVAGECAVRIAVRQRPLSDAEKAVLLAAEQGGAVGADDFIQRAGDMDHNIIVVGDRPFVFDAILDDKVNQEELFVRLVEPMVDKLLSGFYCTVLAYGQTGTGKSYTMGLHSEASFIDDMSGIVPRVLASLFGRSHSSPNADGDSTSTQISVSFVEIYNERVFDLLSEQSTDPVNTKGHKFIGGDKRRVFTLDEARQVLDNGNRNRHVRPTKMNAQSSRSHAIFTIHATVRDGGNRRTEAAMHLVDLAGSEGVRRTGHHGVALIEGVHINQGLLSIGKVLQALSVGNKVIPYRDSVLSSVLQDSLNLNSYLTLVACISPLRDDASETLSTVRFAQSAKSLRHTPQVNAIISEIKKTRTPSKVKTPKKHLSRSSILTHHSPLRPRNTTSAATPSVAPPLAASTSYKRRPTVPLFRSKANFTPSKVVPPKSSMSATSAAKSTIQRRPVQSMAFGDRPSTLLANQSQMFLNVSSSTTVGDQSHIESSSYSPIIRRCMQEMSLNLGDQIRNIVMSMQSNGSLSHHRTAVLDQEVEPMSTDDLPPSAAAADETQPEVTAHSFGHWTNGDATAIAQPESRSSLHELFSEPNGNVQEHDFHPIDSVMNDDLGPDTTILFAEPNHPLEDTFKCPDIPMLPAQQQAPVRRSTRRRTTIDERRDGQHIPRQPPTRQSARISMRRQTIHEPVPVTISSPNASSARGNSKASKVRSTKTDNILAQLTGAKTTKQAKDVQQTLILNMFNTGSMKELQILPQIGPKMAYQIITYRTTNGKLKSIADIAEMPMWRGRGWERFATLNCLQ